MATETNKLAKIPKSDWTHLRDLYTKNWPENHVGSNTIQNYIEWFKKDPNIRNIEFYSLNGDWSDGTFLIIDRNAIYTNTLSDTFDRLLSALNTLDKSKSYVVFGIRDITLPVIQKYSKSNNWKFDPKIWYYLDRKTIENFKIDIPEGVALKQLTEEKATVINEMWPHRHPGSINYVKRLIRYNYSLGVFKKDTNELIAWCLRLPHGAVGFLNVKDDYKKQGYGSLLVKSMAKYYYDIQQDIAAPVVATNIASRNMFKKLGFRKFEKVNVLTIKSNDPNYVWDETNDN